MSTAESTPRTERVDSAIAEWLEADDEGRAPDDAEFLARFPDIADDLRTFLADHRRFHRLAPSVAEATVANHIAVSEEPLLQRLGDFAIVREIGRGGMGIVYEALQVSLKRNVALKVLRTGAGIDPRNIQRFQREAEAAALLRHADIVPIFATGEESGHYYYAMELVAGSSLDRLQPSTAPSHVADFTRIAGLMAGVARALDFAHGHGIIHRDVKPSNLLMATDGRLRISDFGLARIGDEPGMTLTYEIIGSPAYMSPEQAAGRMPIDRRSDIYSLGVTLYEMLALRPPFIGSRRDDLLLQIIHGDASPPSRWNPRVPYPLETICLHAIEKDPVRRYQSSADLARDLEQFCLGGNIVARRQGMMSRSWGWARCHPGAAALALVVLVAALLTGHFARSARDTQDELDAARLQDAVDDALLANMSGDAEAAGRGVARAAELEPDSGWLPFLHGHLAFQRGDYDAAVGHLQKAVEKLPESVAVRALLAAAYVGAGWWERYEAMLAELERLAPRTAEDFMFRGLAESYLDPARARASLDEAIRRRRLPTAYVMRAEVCSHLAMDTASRADADAAVSDADLACEMLPDNPAALLARLFAHHVASGVYADLDLDDESQTLLELAETDVGALEPFSHLASVARARAWFYLYTDREPKAFEILKAAAGQSENARVAYRYALLLYRRGEFADGLALLDRREHRSNNEEMLRILLLMELPEGKLRAREAYQVLERTSPEGLAALFRPALLLLMGDRQAAAADSRRLRDRQPTQLPPLRRTAYDRLLQFHCGDLPADELLSSVEHSQWDLCEAQFFVGLALIAAGDREAAAEHFRAAVRTRCDGFLACDWSEAFLLRLAENPHWPAWIPGS